MNHPIDNLLEQAKKLSADERAALIDALHELNALPDPEWEAAWIRECKDRLAALDRGEMQTYYGDEVMAEAHARLKRI
ncbi:MAG: addiction module protein [Betaproteobacteria bacterium]